MGQTKSCGIQEGQVYLAKIRFREEEEKEGTTF
jgi:hypothetical protein